MTKKQRVGLKKKLPRNIRYGLFNPRIKILIKELCKEHQLISIEKEDIIFGLIENFVAGELNDEALRKKLFQNFKFNNNKTIVFLEDFKKIVEELKKIGIKAVKEDLVVLKFKDLLIKFPEIKKQNIGVNLMFFPGEKREREPFIENWIRDYQLRKNDKQENAILNISDYLYNSENARQLSLDEKQELAIVLSSFESNNITYYNTLFKRIDFDIIKLIKKTKKTKSKFNIIKLESKPYHEVDVKKGFKPELKEKADIKKTIKPELAKKTVFQKKAKKPEERKILDLNNYI